MISCFPVVVFLCAASKYKWSSLSILLIHCFIETKITAKKNYHNKESPEVIWSGDPQNISNYTALDGISVTSFNTIQT